MEREQIADLTRRIGDDLQVLARDHVELAKRELTHGFRAVTVDGVAALLGGIVALIGFAMLCATAVVALAPLIPALWLRMLLLSIVYLLAGGAVAAAFARKLRRDVPPRITKAATQARITARSLTETVRHG
jgi:hypothetical protein